MLTRGQALREFVKIVGTPPVIIAAGDDNNDASMLAVADIQGSDGNSACSSSRNGRCHSASSFQTGYYKGSYGCNKE